MITVRIGREEHNLEQVLEAPADLARSLDRAKTQLGHAECGCSMASPRPKLVIRRYGKIFILARWPDVTAVHSMTGPRAEARRRPITTPSSPPAAFMTCGSTSP